MAASDAPDSLSHEEQANRLIDTAINQLVMDRVRLASMEPERPDQKSDEACPQPVSPPGTPLASPRSSSATFMRAVTGVSRAAPVAPDTSAPVAPDTSARVGRVLESMFLDAMAPDASDGSDAADSDSSGVPVSSDLPLVLYELILEMTPDTPVRAVPVRASPGAPARRRASTQATRFVRRPVAFGGSVWSPLMTRAQRLARREFAVWLSEPAAAPSSPTTWVAAPVASWGEESGLLTLSLE
jgi:hypothetical protein